MSPPTKTPHDRAFRIAIWVSVVLTVIVVISQFARQPSADALIATGFCNFLIWFFIVYAIARSFIRR